ncbi:unnamed protein product, partial [marine sediment metagenome]
MSNGFSLYRTVMRKENGFNNINLRNLKDVTEEIISK